MTIDEYTLIADLFGKKRSETRPSESKTSTIIGVATSDSALGSVRVRLNSDLTGGEDGELVIPTEAHVQAGDVVSISLVGGTAKAPRVTGTVGGGDRTYDYAATAHEAATQAVADATQAKNAATRAASDAASAAQSASEAATSAENAESSATQAAGSATAAETSASAAQTSASNAQASAGQAATAASNAQTSAGQAATSAQNAATQAQNAASEAATAKQRAQEATTSANEAKDAATAANTAANDALVQVATVEDVIGTVNWITEHGTYAKTTDTAVDDSKVYYTRSGSGTSSDPYIYTAVAEPTQSGLSSYYELSIDQALSQYVASHLALTDAGLYVIKDGNGYKLLCSNTGVQVIDPQGHVVTTYGESITFDSSRSQYIGNSDAFILFTPASGSTPASIQIGGANVTIGGTAPSDFLTSLDISTQQTSTGADITVAGQTVHLANGAKGDKGDTGDTGPQGETGPQGPQGGTGAAGLNSATVYLYKRASSASKPTSGTSTYTFSTGVLSSVPSGWSQTFPAETQGNTTPVWMMCAVASANTATDTIGYSEWTTPVKMVSSGSNGTNGTSGTDGYNQATVTLYQRAASAPGKPSGTVTYTFSTGALSSTPSGWSRSVPSGSNPCYVTQVACVSRTDTYSIASSAWTTPTKLVEDGAKGDKGDKGDTGDTGPQGAAGPEAVVVVSLDAVDWDAGTATLRATLRVDGTVKTSGVTYKWTKGTATTSLGTSQTLSVSGTNALNATYNCTCGWSDTSSHTQVGSIDLAATNGVHLYAKAGFTNAEQTYATQAELSVTNTNVSSKVSKDSVISEINQSAETVKIQASKVEIDGTAIFNSISSDVDSAITSKGYQTSSQVESAITSKGYATTGQVATAISTAVDNIDVGGRNLALQSQMLGTIGATNRIVGKYGGTSIVSRSDGFNESQVYANWGGIGVYANSMGFAVGEKLIFAMNVRNDSTVGNNLTFYCMATNSSGTRIQSALLHLKTRTGETDYTSINIYANNSFLAGAEERIVIEITWLQAAQDLLDAGGAINFTVQATSSDWSKGNVAMWAPKLERSNVATDWTPAPEDAVDKDQLVYIQAESVSSVPTLPTSWVEETGESIAYGTQGDASTITTVWTTKHPTYDRNRPVTFVATQRRTVGGTVTCTQPLPDDTATVIDGGRIITHSIQAHAIESNSLKLSNFSTEVTDKFGSYDQAVGDVGTLSGNVKSLSNKVATFEAVEHMVSSHDGQLTTIMNSLKFNEGELELKTQSGSDSTSVALTSTKLAFRSGNSEVASISNEKLDIENAEVHGTLAFGGFAFIPRSNGNLSLKWIGA